jgi:ribosomal protein L30/L7E
MNDILVIANGIIQSSHEYIISDGKVVFWRVPPPDSTVTIRIRNKTISHQCNGFINVFPIPEEIIEEIRFQEFFKNVLIHKDNPAVKDQLEKLKAIVELLR